MSEKELIATALAGDEDAWETIYRENYGYVRSTAWAVLRTDDVEDVCQEIFVRVFRKLRNFRADAKLRSWITRIAMNYCFEVIRRGRAQMRDERLSLYLDWPAEPDGTALRESIPSGRREMEAVEARIDLERFAGWLRPSHAAALSASLRGESDRYIKSRLICAKKKIRHRIAVKSI